MKWYICLTWVLLVVVVSCSDAPRAGFFRVNNSPVWDPAEDSTEPAPKEQDPANSECTTVAWTDSMMGCTCLQCNHQTCVPLPQSTHAGSVASDIQYLTTPQHRATTPIVLVVPQSLPKAVPAYQSRSLRPHFTFFFEIWRSGAPANVNFTLKVDFRDARRRQPVHRSSNTSFPSGVCFSKGSRQRVRLRLRLLSCCLLRE